MEGIDVHVGQQTRELRVTAAGVLLFKTWMPGNIGLREGLALHRDPGTVAIALAVMLRHKGRGGDEKITPLRSAKWIDAEGARYGEIEAAVMKAARVYFKSVGIIEDDDEGEEKAPPATSTAPLPSGSSSSSKPGDTASTPDSSTS